MLDILSMGVSALQYFHAREPSWVGILAVGTLDFTPLCLSFLGYIIKCCLKNRIWFTGLLEIKLMNTYPLFRTVPGTWFNVAQ